jgi:putative membrane-bound dehydrogenase-like protein
MALLATLALGACHQREGPPLAPSEATSTFVLEDGFAISLLAAEPQVASPVALEFDEDGRLFVAEMPGYPLDTRPTGRIRLLEDTNGDGRPDKSTVFADDLVLPTGVMRFRQGVLVTAAPDVLYLADENGDGRAERRERILTGFAFSNPQHTVNSPVFGLDNWIHLAHEGPAGAVIYKELFGDSGSALRFVDEPKASSLPPGRYAVRFRLDPPELEAHSGSSQFGHAFDEWGHYFTLDNSNHLRHEVVAAAYLKRNPELPIASAMQNVSDHGSNAKVFAITRSPRFELLTEPGEFTSACGLHVYLGGAFPSALGHSAFVAEPAQNLLHRDVLAEAGSTFVARRAKEAAEFLASTDPWFRPVNVTTGPDGALYVVDYYRQMIEHPEWASTHVHQHEKDTYAGQDRGRIWRITPAGRGLPWPNVRLGSSSDQELVAQLANENAWWRRTAQRLLVERKRTGAAPLLVRLVTESPSALGRLHGLYTLEGLGRLEDSLIERALRDPEAGVRENALRLAEPRLRRSPALVSGVLALADDPSPKVRFQLVLTLGGLESGPSRAVQDRLLQRDFADAWVQVAALSASPARAAELLASALSPEKGLLATERKGSATYLRQAAQVVGARPADPTLTRLLRVVTAAGEPSADWWRSSLLEGLAQGAEGRGAFGAPAPARAMLVGLAFDRSPAVRRPALKVLHAAGKSASPELAAAVSRATTVARDSAADPELRGDALRLLGLAGPEPHRELLLALLDVRQPEGVQAAAAQALGRVPGPAVGEVLLARWRGFTGKVRSEAVNAMLADAARTRQLVAALKAGDVPTWGLSFWQKRDLIMHDDPAVRAEARPLLEAPAEERTEVLAKYRTALDGPGDASRGAQVFERACAKCHRIEGRGSEVGPDLGSVHNKPPSLLLEDILVPSRAIAQGYESYVVETTSGDTFEGVLGPESPTAIVLRHEGTDARMVPRAQIGKMYASQLSAMPADLEQQVDVTQMADLLRYLTAPRR